jgi:autotransporter-associated beta strand protein
MGVTTTSGRATASLDLSDGTVTSGKITMSRVGSTGSATSTLNLTGGSLTMSGDILRGVTSGSGASTARLILDGATLDMGGNDIGLSGSTVTVTFASGALRNVASINGSGGLAKTGGGLLVIEGANTYSGATAVSDGELQVNGSIPGNVTADDGASLSGTGSIGGNLTVNGALEPGVNGSGRLTATGTLAFGANGNATLAIDRTETPNASGVSGLARATYGGSLTVTASGTSALALGDRFVLFGAASYSGTFAAISLPPLGPGLAWDLRNLSVDGSIRVKDGNPPAVTPPANIVVQAAVPSGIAVSFTASALDAIDGPVPTVAAPPSGSVFPVGVTTVLVSATDSDANTGTASFTVTVQPPTSTKFWDTGAGAGLQAGPGTWDDSTTAAWNTNASGTGPLTPFWTGNTAYFQTGGTNAVTAAGPVTAGAIHQSGTGTVTTISGGNLSINGTGGISNGTGAGTLTVHSPVAVASPTFPVLSTQPVTLNGPVTGAGNLVKSGTAPLTFGSSYSATGDMTLGAGLLHAAGNVTGVGTLAFGAALGSATTASLHLEGHLTASALVARTHSSGTNSVHVAPGKTLTVNGAFSMDTAASGTARLAFTGGGALAVNGGTSTFIVGATSDANLRTFDLNLSGLAAFNANSAAFYIGRNDAGYDDQPNATVTLAPNSSIRAPLIGIGDDAGNGGDQGGSNTLAFTSGSNSIKATTLTVGRAKSGAQKIHFTAGGGTLHLSGTSGTGALGTMYVGYKPHTGSTRDVVGVADFSNGTLTGSIGNLYVGYQTDSGGSNSPIASGSFALGPSPANLLAVTTLWIGRATDATSGKYADGTVTLAGGLLTTGSIAMTAESYSFARLTLTGGTLAVQGNIGAGPGANESITLDGATLDMTGGAIGDATNPIATLNLWSGTLKNVAAIGGTAALVKSGTGKLVLDGTNPYPGPTTVNAGELSVGTGGTTGTPGLGPIVNQAKLRFHRSDTALSLAHAISGTGSLEVGVLTGGTFGSIVTLTGSSSFTGAVAIQSGALRITRPEALGSGTKTVDLSNGSGGKPSLILAGGSTGFTLPAAFSFQTSSDDAAYPALRNESGSNTISGSITLTFGGGNTRVTVDAGSLALNGNVTPTTTGRALRLDGAAPGIFAGNLLNGSGANAPSLIKEGSGIWTLSGTGHTFAGTVAINGGTLALNGRITSSGEVTVAATASLAGTGTIGSPTVVQGFHRPGNGAVGTLTHTGSLTYHASARIACQLDSQSASIDRVAAGNVTVAAGAAIDLTFNAPGSGVNFTDPFWKSPQSWNVVTHAARSGSFALGSLSPDPGGRLANAYGTFAIVHDPSAVRLTWTPHTARQLWRLTHFNTTANTGNAADSADADGDGESNLEEFATHQNPHARSRSSTELTQPGSDLEFTYFRSKAAVAEGVVFVVEWTDNLAAGPWTSATDEPVSSDAETETRRARFPAGPGGKRYAHLKISSP